MAITMSLLVMLGGVAVFMYGMKLMGQGIEQSAGSGVRGLFKKIDKGRGLNYGVGIAATALLQSSSTTSIMTVGLASAGIVTLKQGAGMVLGAKVGTTLTAFIFALSGVSTGSFSISAIFAALAFIGVIIMYVTNNDSLNQIAVLLLGFGMLFVGLEVMEAAIGGKDSILSLELSKLFQYGIMQNPILLVLLGIAFTSIIQSSTAATGVFLTLLATGVIQSLDQSFFLVMGANIGTCSDGIMASLSTNANGKRIAFFHVLTSTIGAVTFTGILMLLRTPVMNLFEAIFPENPQFSLATFNLIYNTLYTLVLLFFLDPLVNFSTKVIKDKKQKNEKVFFIEDRLLATPTVAIEQALKEVFNMAMMAKENLNLSFRSLMEEDVSRGKRIADRESQIDHITRSLASFFIKISGTPISAKDSKLVGGLHHVINDIERLGDYAVLLMKETTDMKQLDVHFLDKTKTELEGIFGGISQIFQLSLESFETRETDNLEAIAEIHKTIVALVNKTKDVHIDRLSSNLYSVEVSKSLYSVLFSLQRIADHIVNIGFSIRSDTGSKKEAFRSMAENNER